MSTLPPKEESGLSLISLFLLLPTTAQSSLISSLLFALVDISLAKLPGKFVWNRRLRKRDWITTIPIILRNLAPTSGFDPQEVWEKEQELEANEKKELEEKEEKEEGGNAKKPKKDKKKVVSKKDAIIAERKLTKDVEVLDRDMQRITNMKRSGTTKSSLISPSLLPFLTPPPLVSALIGIRNQIKSPIAKLELLLEVLASAVTKKEKTLAFDVFWALEANALYQSVCPSSPLPPSPCCPHLLRPKLN
jgi:hypothetical protein